MAAAKMHEVEVDAEPYIMLPARAEASPLDLSKAGMQVFVLACKLLLSDRILGQHGRVGLNLNIAGAQPMPMGASVYRRGLKELLEKGWLTESSLSDVFLINRKLFNVGYSD